MSAAHALPRIERDVSELLGLGGALSGRDLLGLLCLLLVVPAAWAWRRGPRARWLALVPAIALQLFVGTYAFSGVYGKLQDVGGLTPDVAFADLGWVDRATPGDPHIPLLDNQSEGREGGQRNTVFWNDEVVSIYTLRPLNVASPGFPVFTLPTTGAELIEETRLTIPLPEFAVTAVDSPLFQVAGENVRTAPDGMLALIRPSRPSRITWAAPGLNTDGQVTGPTELRLAGGHRVTLEFAAPTGDGQLGKIGVELADRRVEAQFGSGRPERRSMTFDACDADGLVTGRVELLNAASIGGNRFSGARLARARLTPC